jgi:hypothetical protein
MTRIDIAAIVLISARAFLSRLAGALVFCRVIKKEFNAEWRLFSEHDPIATEMELFSRPTWTQPDRMPSIYSRLVETAIEGEASCIARHSSEPTAQTSG